MTLYSSRVALKAANLWQTNAKPGYGDVAHVDGAAYSVISSEQLRAAAPQFA